MRKRIERMARLVELAQIELDEAAQQFKSLQQQYHAEQTQLEQLQTYLQEYIASQSNGEGSTLQQLKSTNAFMEKLNKAIGQQTAHLEQLNITLEKSQETWVEKRAREQALVKLHDKLQKDLNHKLDKMEQKLLDELSNLKFSKVTPD